MCLLDLNALFICAVDSWCMGVVLPFQQIVFLVHHSSTNVRLACKQMFNPLWYLSEQPAVLYVRQIIVSINLTCYLHSEHKTRNGEYGRDSK